MSETILTKKLGYCIKIICPECGKELQFPFPYNVDLFRNKIVVECSYCFTKVVVNFISKHGMGFQGIYRFG